MISNKITMKDIKCVDVNVDDGIQVLNIKRNGDTVCFMSYTHEDKIDQYGNIILPTWHNIAVEEFEAIYKRLMGAAL